MDNDKNISDMSIDDIILEYTPHLIKYCSSKLNYNNYYDAEEIISNVMLNLCEEWTKLKKYNIRAWLYRKTDIYIKRFLSDRAKYLKRNIPIEELSEDDIPIINDDYEPFLFETDILKYIEDVRDRLNEDEQKLFDYKYIQKMTLKQIMSFSNLPYTTLHDRYDKLNIKIQKLIKELLMIE